MKCVAELLVLNDWMIKCQRKLLVDKGEQCVQEEEGGRSVACALLGAAPGVTALEGDFVVVL